jgi:uncharacterized protein YutE (UPF0331/DUF86 family)
MVQPPLNVELLRSRAADIRQQLAVLRSYGASDTTAFGANPEAVGSARYALVVLVEAAAAICKHICARRLAASPESYADCFLKLTAAGLLPPDLGPRLAAMARLRNLLVHRYETIDDARFHRYLRRDLADVDAYLHAVDGLIEATEVKGDAP